MIKEVIVVEGRDDEAAVHNAVSALTIATHGYGIRQETFDLIEKAYNERGLIIFTDPDFAGDKIRKRLIEKFPNSKNAYLPKSEGIKGNDIGIENANPESIREALSKAKYSQFDLVDEFAFEDLVYYGLVGSEEASKKRELLGKRLGIGYGNGKEFLKRLNQFAVKREDLESAISIDLEKI